MRKERYVTIDAEGRDKGKTYLLTEMSCYDAERWANQLVFGLMNSGVEVPDNILNMGLAGIAAMGVSMLGRLPFEKAEPLLERMWQCVAYVPDVKTGVARPGGLVDGDVEEVRTMIHLRAQVLDLHTGFFSIVASLKSDIKNRQASGADESNMPISPEASQLSSPESMQPLPN